MLLTHDVCAESIRVDRNRWWSGHTVTLKGHTDHLGAHRHPGRSLLCPMLRWSLGRSYGYKNVNDRVLVVKVNSVLLELCSIELDA